MFAKSSNFLQIFWAEERELSACPGHVHHILDRNSSAYGKPLQWRSFKVQCSTTIIQPSSIDLSGPPHILAILISPSTMQQPDSSDTEPSRAVLDSFKTAIAKRLSDVLPLTLEQAFSGVDYGKKGEDFTVALPRFRLPGKVADLAAKVIESVSPILSPSES